jgi:hypothetical protein
METSDVGVYGEAKGEYTRQLCVFLVPALETYFLDLLAEAKQNAAGPSKELLTFQNMLQGIPDWNQDKVIRETGRIQADTKCDYLEELLTAVFIAHTKVLSAIRLTSKQKKLQITIPKLDHFLHRVLSECARSLWSNAFLFAGANSIERQKNLRQVEHLIQEAVLQAIRGLLPVKSILREYLVEDDDEEEGGVDKGVEVSKPLAAAAPTQEADEEAAGGERTEALLVTEGGASVEAEESEQQSGPDSHDQEVPVIEESVMAVPIIAAPESVEPAEPSGPPVLDLVEGSSSAKPSVQFNDKAMVFSESGLEEVDLIEEEPGMESIDTIEIGNEVLPMDEFEDLEKPQSKSVARAAPPVREPSPIAFEELN